MFYVLHFNEEGWAYFEGATDQGKKHIIIYKDIGNNKKAIEVNGRVAIQDTFKRKSTFIDKQCGERTIQTLQLAPQEKLTFVDFMYQRGVLASRLNAPYEIGGKILWEFRCLQQL